jgi:hypothetical protein
MEAQELLHSFFFKFIPTNVRLKSLKWDKHSSLLTLSLIYWPSLEAYLNGETAGVLTMCLLLNIVFGY